jgi:hypothetical protein
MSSSNPERPGHKRKRSRSLHRNLPPEAINPHSHPPNLLKQFRAAGLPETELLPSVPDFPHRPLPRNYLQPADEDVTDADADADDSDLDGVASGQDRATEGGTTTEGQSDASDATRERRAAVKRLKGVARGQRERERNIGVLVAILRRCVDEGDMVRARRAFGLLVRANVDGRRVDLRSEGFWGLGAEILMREGERPPDGTAEADDEVQGAREGSGRKRRWGSARNMVLVRRFFEDLIQLYPYNRTHPEAVSALDFYPVLFSCEMYNAHAELELALERAEEEEHEEDSEMQEDYGTREGRMKAVKDELRVSALGALGCVTGKMDELLMTLPYSKSLEMLRLRGMIALFMGDLEMPAPPRDEDEDEEGTRRRDTERMKAVELFKKVLAGGGEVEPWIRRLVAEHDGEYDEEDSEDDDGAPIPLPKFSSLPMR